MTVEERARKTVASMICNRHASLVDLIAEILRDQIEDCAKVLDRLEKEKANICARTDKSGFVYVGGGFALQAVALAHAATEIRALAGQTDQPEGKEIESHNKCIMLGCEKGAIDPDNFGRYCQDHQIKTKKGGVER